MTNSNRKIHPLTVLHLLLMAAVLGWWSIYFWHHTATRDVWRVSGRHSGFRNDRGHLEHALGESVSSTAARTVTAIKIAGGDLALGLCTWLCFAVATGVYVRKVEIWLQARAAGEAMDLAGSGLSDRALAANVDDKGIIRRGVTR
jgi:hypothetical protein